MILPHHDDYRPPRGSRAQLWVERIILIVGAAAGIGVIYLFGDALLR